MIKINNISHKYGDNLVLNNVSFDLNDEQLIGIIGGNGAGKSTLFSIISNVLQPLEGNVLMDDIDIRTLKTDLVAQKLAVLRQLSNIQIKLTVEELIAFGRFPHSKGKLNKTDKEKIEEAIKYMQLENKRHKFIDQLSGGERQRALIAMVLAQDTKYILLDEPLNNLDIKYAIEMMIILKNLVRDFKKTIVVIMHDINMAASYCDQMIALKKGVVTKVGTPEEMIHEEILEHIYECPFKVIDMDGKKFCMYHQNDNQIDEKTS